MLLSLTLVDRAGQTHRFACYAFAFEEAFFRAKHLLSHTDRLVEARLIEAKKLRTIPVELFDGYNGTESARALGEPW